MNLNCFIRWVIQLYLQTLISHAHTHAHTHTHTHTHTRTHTCRQLKPSFVKNDYEISFYHALNTMHNNHQAIINVASLLNIIIDCK